MTDAKAQLSGQKNGWKVGEVEMITIDIDMPSNCDECRFNTEYDFCKAMPDNFCGNTDNRKRPGWCPLKELIKCKDCKWLGRCELSDLLNNETGFCPDGERDS